MPNSHTRSPGGALRLAARVSLLAGAAGSLALMLQAARHQNSRVLLLLFGAWVLSPFLAAGLAEAVSQRWPVLTRATLHVVMLLLALASLAIYADVAVVHPKAKIGFVFLMVPLASWVLSAVPVLAAAYVAGNRLRRS